KITLSLAVASGWMQLDRAIHVDAPFGSILLGGRMALDGRLDLKGTVKLLPEFAARLLGPKLGTRFTLELPVQVSGTMSDPSVKISMTPAELTRILLGGSAPRGDNLPDQVLDEAKRKLRELI